MNATPAFVLTETERKTLKVWTRLAASPRLALRAEIVLAAAIGLPNQEIAERLGVSEKTVARWRQRFQDARLLGIEKEAPRGRSGSSVSEQTVRNILEATYHGTPGPRVWTTRSLASTLGLSPSTVHRVWKTHGIDPRQVRSLDEKRPADSREQS